MTKSTEPQEGASAGHKLGQVVGNWFEEYVAWPLLRDVALALELYPDSRFNQRPGRVGSKIVWPDLEGNTVDYDVVFELGGSDTEKGEIVAAFETFWRRGSRHSKDKARDDSGKLSAIRDTYPTARMLSIYAAGDFTKPAKELVKSRGIDLFYIPKKDIVEVWEDNGIVIDYPDKLPEAQKSRLVEDAMSKIAADGELKQRVADTLWARLGPTEKARMTDTVRSRLSALPRAYAIDVVDYIHVDFTTRADVQAFLEEGEPGSLDGESEREYRYSIEFGDGDTFERTGLAWHELIELHDNVGRLVTHVEGLLSK